jgi:uncharacterized protein YjiS (DUF1127 family)
MTMRTNPSTISLQRSALRSFDRIPQRRAKARGGRRTFLSRILALFRLWQERARTRRQLRELNERELSDIGLTGAQSEAAKPFWR